MVRSGRAGIMCLNAAITLKVFTMNANNCCNAIQCYPNLFHTFTNYIAVVILRVLVQHKHYTQKPAFTPILHCRKTKCNHWNYGCRQSDLESRDQKLNAFICSKFELLFNDYLYFQSISFYL
jgi:hypothetical protein